MRRNKYIVKFTVPNKWGQNNIHYTFAEIIINDTDVVQPKDIYVMLANFCISDLQKSKGVTIEIGDIDFHMISLVDVVK